MDICDFAIFVNLLLTIFNFIFCSSFCAWHCAWHIGVQKIYVELMNDLNFILIIQTSHHRGDDMRQNQGLCHPINLTSIRVL